MLVYTPSCTIFIEFVAFLNNRYCEEPLWRDAFVSSQGSVANSPKQISGLAISNQNDERASII